MCAQSSLPSPSHIHVLLRQDHAWISQTGERFWGWVSSLGFDHSSPERGKKNHFEFHLLWGWERGTGMGERRKILLGIEAIQRTGERSLDVKRVLSSVTLMVSLLIYRIFFF